MVDDHMSSPHTHSDKTQSGRTEYYAGKIKRSDNSIWFNLMDDQNQIFGKAEWEFSHEPYNELYEKIRDFFNRIDQFEDFTSFILGSFDFEEDAEIVNLGTDGDKGIFDTFIMFLDILGIEVSEDLDNDEKDEFDLIRNQHQQDLKGLFDQYLDRESE